MRSNRVPAKPARKKILLFAALPALIFLLHLVDHLHFSASSVPFGSYGLAFVEMPAKKKPRVILLGNSVLQAMKVVPELRKMAAASPVDYEIGNFGITASSIADYIITYQYIKKFSPDLLVVHLQPHTFGARSKTPIFRNESRKLIFTAEMRPLLQNPLIRGLYQKDELVESFVYSYFPLYRLRHISRVLLKQFFAEQIARFTAKPYMDFFPYTLNRITEWQRQEEMNLLGPLDDTHPTILYPEAEALLQFFLDLLVKNNQKTVFIMQENNFAKTSICHEIPDLLRDQALFSFYDFSEYYNKDTYIDSIHPNEQEGKKVAARLHRAITDNL